jgi:hypothetical protein
MDSLNGLYGMSESDNDEDIGSTRSSFDFFSLIDASSDFRWRSNNGKKWSMILIFEFYFWARSYHIVIHPFWPS